MNYFYADAENQPAGPVSEEDLNSLFRGGNITLETFVVPEGSNEWQQYSSLIPQLTPPSRSLVPNSKTSKVSKIPELLVKATKKCPFCAEEIAEAAKKCKHCGETLDVALRAAEEAKRTAATPQQPMVFMNAGGGVAGGGVAPKHNFPHGLHLIVTVLTVGAWFPIWILHYLLRSRSYYY